MNGPASHHVFVGVLATLVAVAILAWNYLRAPKKRRLPARGWAGLAIIVAAEICLYLGFRWVGIYFTPIVWTGYLLLVDGLVQSLRGESLIANSPRRFAELAAWSVPLWLIFEAYNLRLENWTYVGLPESPILSGLGFVWSFATIWPAIFETAELAQVLRLVPAPSEPPKPAGRRAPSRGTQVILSLLGLLLVSAPLITPPHTGRYLFGLVWIGFVPLFEPINYQRGARSLLGEMERGSSRTLASFAVSGAICGILWEFWNYWARAKWLYIFPIGQGTKIFEMPVAGFLGFPAFALECLILFGFLETVLSHPAASRRQSLDTLAPEP
jgi:hypothetical protein